MKNYNKLIRTRFNKFLSDNNKPTVRVGTKQQSGWVQTNSQGGYKTTVRVGTKQQSGWVQTNSQGGYKPTVRVGTKRPKTIVIGRFVHTPNYQPKYIHHILERLGDKMY